MTIDQIRKSDKTMLTPTDVAGLLGVAPYTINIMLKEKGNEAFPFPAFLVRSRVKIPRLQFLRFITDGNTETRDAGSTFVG